MSSYVELFEVKKVYPVPGKRSEVVVVDQFNLRMKQGEVVALLGHSGCGKSTVLTMVAGLNPLSGGGIIVAGREVTGPGPDRAVVFQAPCLLPWLTALGNVRLGVDQLFEKWSAKERLEHCKHILDLVGLAGAHDKLPRELSSGMQQRVGIARALALKPKMLLLDEPFGMLDSLTRMELQEILLQLVEQEKMTAMMVTHDVDEALFVADRVVMMTTGPNAKVGAILELPFHRPARAHRSARAPRVLRLPRGNDRLPRVAGTGRRARGRAETHHASARGRERRRHSRAEKPPELAEQFQRRSLSHALLGRRAPPLRPRAEHAAAGAVVLPDLVPGRAHPLLRSEPEALASSLGISAIIGTGLYLGIAHGGPTKTQLGAFQVFRLYLMPFCVSSFAALIKNRGFWLVLHPTLADNLRPTAACAAFVLTVGAIKRWSAPTPRAGAASNGVGAVAS